MLRVQHNEGEVKIKAKYNRQSWWFCTYFEHHSKWVDYSTSRFVSLRRKVNNETLKIISIKVFRRLLKSIFGFSPGFYETVASTQKKAYCCVDVYEYELEKRLTPNNGRKQRNENIIIACKHISAYLSHLKGFYWLLFDFSLSLSILDIEIQCAFFYLLYIFCSIFFNILFMYLPFFMCPFAMRKERCKIRMIIRTVEWVITLYVTVIWPNKIDHNSEMKIGF